MFQKQNWKHQFRTKFNTHFSWCLSFLSFSSAFSGLSSLIFFLFNPEQWITYVLDTMLGHFTYPYSSLKIYMLAIIASIILLKKKLWLRLCNNWLDACQNFKFLFPQCEVVYVVCGHHMENELKWERRWKKQLWSIVMVQHNARHYTDLIQGSGSGI